METRSAPLPPDLQYFLDGAIDSFELNAFAYDVLTIFGRTPVIDGIVEAPSGERFSLAARQGRCVALDAYAHELARELGDGWQRAFVAATIPFEMHSLGELADCYAAWNFEDSTLGGALQHYRRVPLCDRDYNPTKGARRRLYARSAVRRYNKQTADDQDRFRRVMSQRVRACPWPADTSAGERIVMARQEMMVRHQRLVHEGIARMMRADKEPKLLAKPERKKIVRAARLAADVVGEEKVRRFVAGESVEIEGDGMIIEAVRSSSLTQATGHGQLTVTLKDKDRQQLGNLCVYFEHTPPLDQLAALALHVQAGEGAKIIETGNLYAITPAGAASPLLAGRAKLNPVGGLGAGAIARMDVRRQASAAYAAATKPWYVEDLGIFRWGRDFGRLRRLAGQ